MSLDPVFIFGFGFFPKWGVEGAALATVFSQFLVFLIFIYFSLHRKRKPFAKFSLFKRIRLPILLQILKTGTPVALQSALFTFFAMIIARIISQWGPIPIAVQKVGAQIEAISWMTASGFSTALGAFTGQNYGAKLWDRIQQGYFISISVISIVGLLASLTLIFFADSIFSIFISEGKALALGIEYLKILGYSQLFMCLEITTAGAFYGIGKSYPPAFISIFFNGLRIPGALLLAFHTSLGLSGVWWAISMSSVFKGIILVIWFLMFLHRHPDIKQSWLNHIICMNLLFLRDKRSMCGK